LVKSAGAIPCRLNAYPWPREAAKDKTGLILLQHRLRQFCNGIDGVAHAPAKNFIIKQTPNMSFDLRHASTQYAGAYSGRVEGLPESEGTDAF
jgi:hypothetical protein